MRLRLLAALSGLSWLALCVPAYGATCYQVWNNGDVLVYQSPFTPFDLSAPAFDRAMSNLRTRGGQLIFFDAADCALIGGTVAGQGPGSADPASLLIDVRGGTGGVPRSALLSPMPASSGAASGVTSTGAAAGSMNKPPAAPATGTNTRSPGRY